MTKEPDYGAELRTFGNSSAPSGPETQGIDSWEDAGALPSGLGSSTVPPDATRDIVGPGEESGTFASFVELVIEEFNEDRGAEATTRPDYQASADDNVIIQGIQGSDKIGRASCRARVCQYVYISVVAVSLTKKNKR